MVKRETYRSRNARVMAALEQLLERAMEYGNPNLSPAGRHNNARWLTEAALSYSAAVRTMARGNR